MKKIFYYIVEDCHINYVEAEKFLLRVSSEKIENFKFIFTTRKIGKFILRDHKDADTFHNYLQSCNVVISSNKIKELIKNIIKNFIKIEGIKYETSEDELELAAKRWGNDLYLVHLYLKAWKERNCPKLTDIDKKRVYELLWKGYGEIKLFKKEKREVLCCIAAICQFEPLKIPEIFLRKKLINEDEIEELENLLRRGIIQRYLSNRVGIFENLSQLILSTVTENMSTFNRENYTKILFKEYMELNLRESENWPIIFRALRLARDENFKNANPILVFILNNNELWNELKTSAPHLSLGAACSLIWDILPLDREKGLELRTAYTAKNYSSIVSMVKSSSLTSLRGNISTFSCLLDLNSLLSEFSVSDFASMIKRSSIYRIRSLLFDFENYNIKKEIRVKFVQALISLSDTDLEPIRKVLQLLQR